MKRSPIYMEKLYNTALKDALNHSKKRGEEKDTPQKIKRMMNVPGRKRNPYNEEQRRKGREKALKAMELRTAGVSYRQIAESLGYSSQSNAKRAIDNFLLYQVKDASIAVIETDLARMDEYIQRCTHSLRQNGDLSQIDRLLRIQEAKYRLLGISDEALRTVREQNGVSTTISNNTQVMIVTASKNSEEEFLTKMMRAAGIDPDTNSDAAAYIEEKKMTLLPRKEIGTRITGTKVIVSPKKKRIVRRSKSGQHSSGQHSSGQHSSGQHSSGQHSSGQHSSKNVYTKPYTDLAENEIVDAEIV